MPFIPEDVIQEIRSSSDLLRVAQEYRQFARKGSDHIGECSQCGRQKLTISPKKSIFKCFSCEVGGNDALSYLQKIEGMSFTEACEAVAKMYGISIPDPKDQPKPKKRGKIKQSFAQQQLEGSGLGYTDVKCMIPSADGEREFFRMEGGSMDKLGNMIDGPDMVIHYLDLQYGAIYYQAPGQKKRPYIRVRYKNPDLHKSKDGKPVKYRSPYKSGNHLYIPNRIITAYQDQRNIGTLLITEGEKKSEKLCKHGINAVAISGIHNFDPQSEMSGQLQKIIDSCSVKSVVFLLDSDWQDISFKNGTSVDMRPRTFASAIQKFRDYFYAYVSEGIYLEIFFGYHTDRHYKGIDDLMVKDQKICEQIGADLEEAMIDREGTGRHLKMHKITSYGSYKIREIFGLHSKDAFFKKYRQELLQLKEFTFNRHKYRVEDGKIDLAQQLLPYEHFWQLTDKGAHEFDYVGARHFFKNRGIGRMTLPSSHQKIVVQRDARVMREIEPEDVQNYLLDFVENLEDRSLLNFILKGLDRYCGAARTKNFYEVPANFPKAKDDEHFLYFKNVYWKITAKGIEQGQLSELPHTIWKDQIIDFDPEKLDKPMFDMVAQTDAAGNENIKLKNTKELDKCQAARFMFLTSNFYHEKSMLSDEEIRVVETHLISKILASGYLLHDYKDYSNMKAVVCMDGKEAPVGRSDGGTGKSLFSLFFTHMMPSHIIDAKPKRLTEDAHLYDGVDDRTKLIIYDDCRVNMDFEYFFSQITRGVTVNPKGQRKFTIPAPRMIFNTNHAINGEGKSFERRQYLLSFSDYFNLERTPKDEFGGLFFIDWDHQQWNLFYNFMATCVQMYLRHGLKVNIHDKDIERRRLRQAIGEDFLEWAMGLYDGQDNIFRNWKIDKKELYESFVSQYPNQRRYCNMGTLKKRFRLWCEYSGYDFNPGAVNGRHKSGSKEYFVVADDKYSKAVHDETKHLHAMA